jgi:predicted RNase H-like HicB family nuclease
MPLFSPQQSFSAMLTDYIRAAMRRAHYELMENGQFFASIPECKGLWAEGTTLEACREELQSTLEDWIMIKLRHGDRFEVIDGVDINPQPEYAQAD